MLPTGGVLLMSLAPYTDTDSRYVMKEKDELKMSNTIPHYDYIKQGDTVRDNFVDSPNLNNVDSFGRKEYNKNAVPRTTTRRPEKQNTRQTTTFKYPEAWKNKMPKFPFVPKDDEITTQRPTKPPYNDPWKDGNMPVFPYSYKNTPPPLKVNLT